MKRFYNTEQIVSVKAFDKREQNLIVWKDAVTGFWARFFDSIRSEGYYWRFEALYGREQISPEDYSDLLFTKEQVYEKPRVVIAFSNGKELTKHFDKYEDAVAYANTRITETFFEA